MPTVAELERRHRDLSYLERAQRPRGRKRRVLVVLALLLALLYFTPNLLALTSFRNVPLGVVFEGIEGTITSGSASLGWFSPVVYRDVEIRDREGELVLTVAEVTSEKTVGQLLADRSQLGGWTIDRPQVFAVARADGSNLEDVFLPWWNLPSSGPTAIALQVTGGELLVQDTAIGGKWQIAALKATFVKPLNDDEPIGWSAEGEVAPDNGAAGPRGASTFAVSTAGVNGEVIALRTERLPLGLFRPALRDPIPTSTFAVGLPQTPSMRLGRPCAVRSPALNCRRPADRWGKTRCTWPASKHRLMCRSTTIMCTCGSLRLRRTLARRA